MALMRLLLILGSAVPALATGSAAPGACSTAMDCKLNGDCRGGACVCDAAWRGSADCAVMSFEKVPKAAGKAPGYYNGTESSWGGFPIYADGTWNLIHAQMAHHCPLGSWKTDSIVARSVSTTGNPEGPYAFVEELIPPFAHNPTVRQAADGTFVIYFIGGWHPNVTTCGGASRSTRSLAPAQDLGAPAGPAHHATCSGKSWPKSCGPNMPGDAGQNDCCGLESNGNNGGCGIATATSKSLSGPWKVEALHIVDQWKSDDVYCTHTNPSVFMLPNGSAVMAFNAGYCNKGLETVGVAVSHGGWRGPWKLLARNSILKNPDGSAHKCEDPFIWKSKRGWHLLTHNQQGPQAGSSLGYSLDGMEWSLSPTTPYGCTLTYTDGSSAEASGCGNRPQIFFNKDGSARFIVNGATSAKPGGGKGTWTLFRPISQQS